VQYLAPEQLQGEPADPRTDLYSLGVVAFELLTGGVPFTAETSMAIAYKHIRERVPRPSSRNPSVPKGLDGWVASMTEKERELRPESAAEARRDLEREARHLPPAPPLGELVAVVALPETSPERAPTVSIPRRGGRRRRRGRWILGVLFALLALAAAAWGAWTYLVPHSVDVPAVVGLSVEQAQSRLEDAHLVVKIGAGEYSMRFAEGDVIRTQPPAGTTLRTGSTVTLIPSLGPPPVDVPDLTHLSVADATAKLAKAHLELGARHEVYSDTVAVGAVVRQSPVFGEQAPRGSAIELWLSKGPPPKPVPKVVGLQRDQAESALTTAGFHVAVKEKFSAEIPRDQVIAQDPPAKTKVQPGETVTITVSLGPRTFELPSFKGMTEAAAVAAIRELGLVPAIVPIPGGTAGRVVSQLPVAGTTVKYGQTITIYVA
jgi:serine/threonine-protein kinase